MAENGSIAGFATGLLVGVTVGMAIGFLYAPHSGEETREILKSKTGETIHKAEGVVAEAKERARRIVASATGKSCEDQAK